MTVVKLSPQYNPASIESNIYRSWEEAGIFGAPNGSSAEPYVILIPPPNVTAMLHMGHGLNSTLQDLLIRFERMRGRNALWLPGTDHAGIATQNVVERALAAEGKSKEDLGREAFVERVWEHVRETKTTILGQLKSIGCSCDWSREWFTLDEGLSNAVREVFVRLHEKGLIYRGKYIINWCPRCLTALSNEEAESRDRDGHLWHLRYPIVGAKPDGPTEMVVATTRPETMLGDTAVAVHPSDKRYTSIVGQMIKLPITGRLIPIVADHGVDPEFGTGAVKVTPAHDPLDFEIGKRNKLEFIDIMNDDATMNDLVPEDYRGLSREEARKKVVADLEESGDLVKVEDHPHAVGHCYRCDFIVEPRLSDQWFVKMKPLAEPALKAYRDGEIKFLPERRGDDYERWLVDIRDWCISRQLWWGHRIPAWHCQSDDCGHITVSRETPRSCEKCAGKIRQDNDVLDTWFSSWLLPFSSIGWPEQTEDLSDFYPGHTLVTGADIIFFWVARMIMAGIEFTGKVPFKTVFFNGIVRDAQNHKMSKSRGNGIDPLDVVNLYGADAMRFTVISGSAIGTDLLLDYKDLETTFAVGRNFANKVWNVGRLILSNLDESVADLDFHEANLDLADRWILSRAQRTVDSVTDSLEKFRVNEAATTIYQFVWSELADWYIEQAKSRLYGDVEGGDVARAVLYSTFRTTLKLLHPLMPFVSEELWRHLPVKQETLLAASSWPTKNDSILDPESEKAFSLVQELVAAVRNARAEYNVPPSKEINVILQHPSPLAESACLAELTMIKRLAKIGELKIDTEPQGAGSHAVLTDGSGVFTALGEAIDVERECKRLGAEVERFDGLLRGLRKKLDNEQFVSKAPAEVVDKEREKEKSWREQRDAVAGKLQALGC